MIGVVLERIDRDAAVLSAWDQSSELREVRISSMPGACARAEIWTPTRPISARLCPSPVITSFIWRGCLEAR